MLNLNGKLIDKSMPLASLSIAEAEEFIMNCAARAVEEVNREAAEKAEKEKRAKVVELPHLVYGYKGLAELIGRSVYVAAKIVKSGAIDEAISITGRSFTVDSVRALELLRKSTYKPAVS